MYARVIQIELYAKRFAAFCAVSIAVSAFLYGTFLLIAVEHTAARSKAENKVAQLAGEVSTLETQYLSAIQSLTPDKGAALGFVAPTASAITYAVADAPTLSFNNVGH